MTLLALGLNHHTAPVEIRERAAIGDDRLGPALQALRGIEAVNEAAIVSTCNRTEIYCGVSRADAAPIIAWMHDWFGIDAGYDVGREVGQAVARIERGGEAGVASPAARGMEPYLFRHADLDAVTHLMRVCSGLDSMVLGEPQILGQIKRAYKDATVAGTVGQELSPLFQTAFSVAKQVRTETTIGTNPVSVAFAAVSLARQIFADFPRHTALLIGAGETVQLLARHLKGAGIGRMLIANRTVERAAVLADEIGGEAISLGDITARLHEADIIISSTAAPLPIIGKGTVGRALKQRRYRSMLFVDIAVPRDVEPEVGDLDSVFLYTVDDLQGVIEENRQSRADAAIEAEEIVRHQAQRFMRQLKALGANDVIREYRGHTDLLRQAVLDKARKRLAAGADPAEIMESLSHALANKLMHAPSAYLRESAAQGANASVEEARRVLGLRSPRRAGATAGPATGATTGTVPAAPTGIGATADASGGTRSAPLGSASGGTGPHEAGYLAS